MAVTEPLIKGASLVALKAESTPGTYETPGATDFLQVLSDGIEFTPQKELITRDVLSDSIGKPRPRTGTKSFTASVQTEFKANGTEGGKPEAKALLKALLGTESQLAARVTSKASGNTTSFIAIEDADIGSFAVSDIIAVLISGETHVTPVTAVTTTMGSAGLTVLRVRGSAFPNSVEIAKFTKYTPANTGHDTLSMSVFWGDSKTDKGIGGRPLSMSLENFTPGAIATMNFSLEGISFDADTSGFGSNPTYSTALPPLILNACLYQDTTEYDITEFSMTVENAVANMPSTCSSNGIIGSRVTERNVSGSFSPYKEGGSNVQWTKFRDNTEFSLFIYASNPHASVVGELALGSICAVYLPKCIITEFSTGDVDGVLLDAVTFVADRGVDGSTNEIVMSFI